MPARADSATLNVQPRQRRDVYESLAKLPEGRSVKDLLGDLEIPESELRETLRKLDRAGLVRRAKGTWCAIPLEPTNGEPTNGEPPTDGEG
jgi:DNA-binding transcriptional ArsR family regulator